jgi:hypothetical protein
MTSAAPGDCDHAAWCRSPEKREREAAVLPFQVGPTRHQLPHKIQVGIQLTRQSQRLGQCFLRDGRFHGQELAAQLETAAVDRDDQQVIELGSRLGHGDHGFVETHLTRKIQGAYTCPVQLRGSSSGRECGPHLVEIVAFDGIDQPSVGRGRFRLASPRCRDMLLFRTTACRFRLLKEVHEDRLVKRDGKFLGRSASTVLDGRFAAIFQHEADSHFAPRLDGLMQGSCT